MIGRVHNLRANVVLGLFIGFGLLLVYRLVGLQLLRHQDYVSDARQLHSFSQRIPPRRGMIVDRLGSVLATSVESNSLFAVPCRVCDPVSAASRLAPVLGMDAETLEERLRGTGWFRWVKRHLSETEAEAVRALNLPGLELQVEMKRVYPKGSLLSQVIGLTDIDGFGLEGLELQFDHQLRGRPGWRLSERDSRQRELLWFRSHDLAPVAGSVLVLTVDEVAQSIAEEELEWVWREYQAGWACLMIMEVGTGNILAMANRPTFDPNLDLRGPADHRRNRSITDTFEPGSTFKVFAAASALEKGVVDFNTRIYCENGLFRGDGFTLHDHRPFQELTFLEVITKSSNIGMAKVGLMLGEDTLYRHLAAFQIGERTGINLPGEAPGLLRPPRYWSRLSLSRITMGHEVAMTPLGLLTSFAALGNDGKIVQPRIIDRIQSATGETLYIFPTVELGQAVSPAVARRMRYLLTRATEADGTGRHAAVPGLQVAGKTGTTQKYPLSEKKHIASFVGMLPASSPRFAILVVVDEPRPDYYGGVVAAPVFRRVAERLINQMETRNTLGLVYRETQEIGGTASRL